MNNQVPVLLVIFNRPEKTRRVIEALRQIRPARLFISADGPRPDHPEDEDKCRLAREFAMDIDWPCDLKTRFLDQNIGCGLGVSTGITWFFEHVEHGIILEDDCVPHPSFFPFCKELFELYADDERIMRISGLAPFPAREYPFDYHFSWKFYCSGWGTWRRAWKHFFYDLNGINKTKFLEMLKVCYPFHYSRRPWLNNFERTINGDLKTWAFRWDIACFAQNGLSINPEKNLITNIGYGEGATHTQKIEPIFANLEGHSIKFPMRHPKYVYADGRPEQGLQKELHCSLPLKSRVAQRVRHALGLIADFWETMP